MGQSWSLGARWRRPADLELVSVGELSPARPPRPRDQPGVQYLRCVPTLGGSDNKKNGRQAHSTIVF